jgi:hypothetical protein
VGKFAAAIGAFKFGGRCDVDAAAAVRAFAVNLSVVVCAKRGGGKRAVAHARENHVSGRERRAKRKTASAVRGLFFFPGKIYPVGAAGKCSRSGDNSGWFKKILEGFDSRNGQGCAP